MALTASNPFELLVDDHHGQYIGHVFAKTIKRELFPTISDEDWMILETGPDHEYYSEVCANLDQHETEDGISLYWQDGALWAVKWEFIGHADDLHGIGETAIERLQCDKEAWNLYCELRANLYDGPGKGVWGNAELSAMRDHIERIAQDIESDLPKYVSTDYGIEEFRIDVESEMLTASPGLRELSQYW